MLFLLEWLMVKLGVNYYGVVPRKHNVRRKAARRAGSKSKFFLFNERVPMRFF